MVYKKRKQLGAPNRGTLKRPLKPLKKKKILAKSPPTRNFVSGPMPKKKEENF